MAEIIDLTTFRTNEPQQVSLYDLVEQAEVLVVLQKAVLEDYRSTTGRPEPHKLTAVANSLEHLRRNLKIIKTMIAQL